MSFRRYGGLNYAPKNNIMSSNYNNINNLSVSQAVGQSNSYINFLSDISGNISVIGNITAKEQVDKIAKDFKASVLSGRNLLKDLHL